MSSVAPYMTRLYHGPGSWVRVMVNDLPMYDEAAAQMTTANFPATPWFIPGENEVVIEVTEAPPNPHLRNIPTVFELLLFGEGPVLSADPEALAPIVPLYEQKYPEFLQLLPAEERKLPARWTASFTPEGNIPAPLWADADVEKIPEKGTPELLKAVHEMHAAFGRKDVDAMLDATTLQLEDQRRYHGNHPRLARQAIKEEHLEMLEGSWDLAPFDPDKIRFRSCAGGRVAYATDPEGGPALYAKNGPHEWKYRPLLMRRGADWRIYR